MNIRTVTMTPAEQAAHDKWNDEMERRYGPSARIELPTSSRKPPPPAVTQDELERIAKLAGIPPQDFPKGKAAEPGPTVITDPMGWEKSTGDVNLPKASDMTKPYITGEPEKNYDKTEQPPQTNPVTVKPEQPDDKPTPDALAAFKDMMDKLAQDQELEPQPVTKPESQPKTQDELYKELLAKEPEQQRVTPTEPEKTEPEKTEPKPQAPSYARPTPTTSFNKPVEKPPEEPAKTEPQPQAPSYARPSPTTTFDKPAEKPADQPVPAQPSQTQPAPSMARPAPTGTFNTPQQQPAQTKPADQGKPNAPTNNKFTPDGYELATDDPNDHRPITRNNRGELIIDPYITKGAVTPGGREAFAQKEFGTSAEERYRRANTSRGDERDREYNMSRGPRSGPSDGPSNGPRSGPRSGPSDGPSNGPRSGPNDGPDDGPDSGGRWRNHDWVVFKNPFTGSYIAGSPQETDWLNSGQDLSGFEKVGPGQYVSKLPKDHPEYDPKKHSKPPNSQPGSYEGERKFHPNPGSSVSQPITVNPRRRQGESTDYSLGGLQAFAKQLRERAYYQETGIAEATPPVNDKPQMAVSVSAGQPKPATPAPLSTDPNATKTTAAGTPVPPAQPAGPAGITAPKPVDTSSANPASGTSSANNSTNMPKPANNSEPVENSGETTESINTLRRLAGLNK